MTKQYKISLYNILLYFYFFISALFSSVLFGEEKDEIKTYLSNLPFQMKEIILPIFPDRNFNILEFGASGDGLTKNTDAFAKAIKACFQSGGGHIIVPPGFWLTGPIELMSNIDLHLEKGALVVFSPARKDYPLIPTPNKNSKTYTCKPPIYGYELENIAITGEGSFNGNGQIWRPIKRSKLTALQWKELISSGGVVNEKGDMWWPSEQALNAEKYLSERKRNELTKNDYENIKDFLRTYMLYLEKCKNILVDGITLQNSPTFAMHIKRGENIVVRHVKVMNEWWAQNGDGLDLSDCKNVLMYKCTVNAGDDGICIKSNGNPKEVHSVENIVIADCVVYHGHGGFVIGSNTKGGIKNISVKNCNFVGTDTGLRFKSGVGRGSIVENIFIDGIYMKDIQHEAIIFDMFYVDMGAVKTKDEKVESEKIPQFKKIYIKNLVCDGAEKAFLVKGLDFMPVQDVYLSNSNLITKEGFESSWATGFEFENVIIISQKDPVFLIKQSSNFMFKNVLCPVNTNTFLKLEGDKTKNIILQNINLSNAKVPYSLSADVNKNAVIIK
jgi:DNA sulfur modification protein DndE